MLVIAGAGVLVALAALGAVLGDRSADDFAAGEGERASTSPERAADTPERPPTPELHAEYFAEREPDDPRALGDPDAPIVMIEWGDFLCGFCARYARETEPELIERYVDTGLLRIEWRDLPLQGEDAWTAALAGRAAAEQDAFWDLHEVLYAESPTERSPHLTREGLRAIADDLGLDVAAFEAALDDPEIASSVAGERQAAQALGIQGTPAFLVHGQPIVGAQPLQVFSDVIEAAATDLGIAVP